MFKAPSNVAAPALLVPEAPVYPLEAEVLFTKVVVPLLFPCVRSPIVKFEIDEETAAVPAVKFQPPVKPVLVTHGVAIGVALTSTPEFQEVPKRVKILKKYCVPFVKPVITCGEVEP